MIDRSLAKDKDKIISHVNERIKAFGNNRNALDRLAYTSILFYRGEQWVTFDQATLSFHRTNLRKIIPRPITNKMAPALNAIVSALSRFDPKIVIAPQTDTFEDIHSAGKGNRIIKSIESEIGWERLKSILRPWLVTTGNAFLILGVDNAKGPKQRMITTQCPQCNNKELRNENEQPQNCPECASEGLSSPMEDQIDGRTGASKSQLINLGTIAGEVASLFEMFLDYRIPHIQDHQGIGRIHPKDLAWAKLNWPEHADKIEAKRRPELNARILEALSSLTFPSHAGDYDKTTVDIIEWWEKPGEKFKDGFYLVMSSEDTIHDLYKYKWLDNRNRAFIPIIHFPFDKIPGCLLARTPAFDLIEKQRTRNRVEALGELIIMRMSNPVWTIPTRGVQGNITGVPGQKIMYDPQLTGGHRPERVEASQMPPGVLLWMDRIDRDFAELSAQFEIARGERPLAVRSGLAISKLQEISRDRNTELFNNWSQAVADFQTIAFEIFRKITPDERYTRILGDESAWTVSKIKEADLRGGIDIWAEPGNAPKTFLEKLAAIEFMVANQILDITDPVLKLRVLREYGLANLMPELDADDQYIAREQDRFMRSGNIAVSPFDNHSLHLQRHLDLFKSEVFEEIDPEYKKAFFQHIIEHAQAASAAQQQMAAPQQQQQPQRSNIALTQSQ